MKTVYVLGYQPIDIISKDYKLVDIINRIVSDPATRDNYAMLSDAIINTLHTMTFENEDKLLINSYRGRDFIPFCPTQNTILYDPPFLSSASETQKLFRDISSIIGAKTASGCYNHSANIMRTAIATHSVTPSKYYNALTLLTDLNHSDPTAINAYLNGEVPAAYEVKNKAIFYGDPIDPTFFDTLASKGVEVVSYLPYETFLRPVNDSVKYYSTSLLFEPIMSITIELKRLIRTKQATMLILNPGKMYLTNMETKYLVEQLGQVLPVYVLPGTYKGADIVV